MLPSRGPEGLRLEDLLHNHVVSANGARGIGISGGQPCIGVGLQRKVPVHQSQFAGPDVLIHKERHTLAIKQRAGRALIIAIDFEDDRRAGRSGLFEIARRQTGWLMAGGSGFGFSSLPHGDGGRGAGTGCGTGFAATGAAGRGPSLVHPLGRAHAPGEEKIISAAQAAVLATAAIIHSIRWRTAARRLP